MANLYSNFFSFNSFRVYYNQAVPDGNGNLRLVNWYDSANLGMHKVPLLPNSQQVYSNFNGRNFKVPVFHVSFRKVHSYVLKKMKFGSIFVGSICSESRPRFLNGYFIINI